MEKLIFMIDDFNPITKDQREVIEQAINLVNADKCALICNAEDYLLNKFVVKEKNRRPFILNKDIRKEMINSLSSINSKIFCLGTQKWGIHSVEGLTLRLLMKRIPNCEYYLLIGADKLESVSNWMFIDDILPKIKFVVYQKEGYDISKIVEESTKISSNRVITLKTNKEIDKPSQMVRDLYLNNQDYSTLLDESVYEILSKIDPLSFKELSSDEYLKIHFTHTSGNLWNLSRKEVYLENLKMFKNWFPATQNGKDVIENKYYNEQFKVSSSNDFDTKFECKNMDCSEVALELEYEGLNPVILNSMNAKIPGYGYSLGIDSFEASLCRMSNLSLALTPLSKNDLKAREELNLKDVEGVLPLDENYGGIYSSNVTFFRNNIDKFYSLREAIFGCNVISIPSLSNSRDRDLKSDSKYFEKDGYLSNEGKEVEKNKIRTIFRIALDNSHDSIVLNAFGCGQGRLNPSEISSLFKEILNEDEFYHKFKKIVFAIYEGREDPKFNSKGKEGKYKPFYDLFN